MGADHVQLRELTGDDGPGLAGLSFSSSDEGLIRYAANYQIDAVQAIQAIHGNVQGVVACTGPRVLGVALVRFGVCRYEGRERPFALFGNLVVHPDFRGQGLATRMTRWRVDLAHRRLGEEAVLLANFQAGNTPSLKIVRRWARQIAGPFAYLPLRVRERPPAALPGVTFREAAPHEIPAFVDGLADFYQDYNLFQPLAPEALAGLVRRSPFEAPVRRLFVAAGRDGRLLAGLAALEEYRLKWMEVRQVSRLLRLLASFVRILPPDGAVRQVYLDRVWFRPGQPEAARRLVETLRWEYRQRASNLSVFFDPRGRLRELFGPRPWSVRTRSSLAVAGPEPLELNHLVCPIY
jgi:GNAT superfamily N-acetyltransferase